MKSANWIVPALCAGTMFVGGCVIDPKVTADTPYEGNVSPLAYKPVSGVTRARSETAELMGAVAVGLVGGQQAAQGAAMANTRAVVSGSGLECHANNEWTK